MIKLNKQGTQEIYSIKLEQTAWYPLQISGPLKSFSSFTLKLYQLIQEGPRIKKNFWKFFPNQAV